MAENDNDVKKEKNTLKNAKNSLHSFLDYLVCILFFCLHNRGKRSFLSAITLRSHQGKDVTQLQMSPNPPKFCEIIPQPPSGRHPILNGAKFSLQGSGEKILERLEI